MEPSESIGQRIKLVRGELSQKVFGQRIGLSQTAVTALENDQSEPRLGTYNSIIEAFNVSPEWLRTGTGAMLRTGRTLVQLPAPLPPQVPAHFEELAPRPGYFKVTADGDELRQVKDERDNLRKQVDRLLGLLEANTYAVPAAAGGKAEASADAAAMNLYQLTDRLCVAGLRRYTDTPDEVREAAHFDIGGERKAA